jgi:4-carboxymuconolactone decarboxylase
VTVERLNPVTRGDLTGAQAEMWDYLVGGNRGARAVRSDGRLTGPYDALLRSPRTGLAVAQLAEHIRFGIDLDPQLREVVVLTVAARWRAEFAWAGHATAARTAGVPEEIIDAIAAGALAPFADAKHRAARELTLALLDGGELSPELYDASRFVFGEAGIVDLIALTGYYIIVAMTLNAFAVAVPDGEVQRWSGAV